MKLSLGVVAGFSFLLSLTAMAQTDFYVDPARPDDSGDGLSWATAKQTLAGAAGEAGILDTIWATNGVYDSGSMVSPGGTTANRVVLDGVKLRAAEGCNPIIDGADAMRCVFMTNYAWVVGFELRNGTADLAASDAIDNAGGGALLYENCLVRESSVTNCTATRGGGIYCRAGGTVRASTVSANHATRYGGGIYLWKDGLAENTLLETNHSDENGGALYFYQGGKAVNCTTRNNSATVNGNELDFVDGGTVQNCIAWNENGAMDRAHRATSIEYTCATDSVTNGANHCFTNAPLFAGVSGDALATNSPCINAGTNGTYNFGSTDRHGALRIFDNTVDLGSFESPGTSQLTINDHLFSVLFGASTPVETGIFLNNRNNMPCDWTLASALPGWLSVSDSGGSLGGKKNSLLNFSADPSGLAAGPYVATNIFTATFMEGAVTQEVSLVISDADLFIDGHDFSAPYNGAEQTQVLELVNNGSAIAEWMVSTPPTWLVISETNGTLAVSDSANLLFSANPAGLLPGTYVATNRFSAPSMAGAFTQLVSLAISDSDLAITDHAFSAPLSTTAAKEQMLVLTNRGTATATWTISGDPSWLTIFPESGTLLAGAGTNLLFSADPTVLPAGTYVATNLFNASSMLNTFTQRVSFTITDFDYYVSIDGNDANVGTNWSAAKASIQAAVDAQEHPGGMVFVSNGTYNLTAEIVVSKRITIESLNGPEVTILDGGGNHRCLVLSNSSKLDGFTVSNGHADGASEADQSGGGAFVNKAYVSNCIFESNWAKRVGGGLVAQTAGIYNCRFLQNEVDGILLYGGAGGGAAIENSEMEDCLFTSNSAHYGGGLAISNSAIVTSSFLTNEALINGGGLYLNEEGNLYDLVFIGNEAGTDGGALYMNDGGLLEIGSLTNNRAGEDGGAIYIADNDDDPGDDAECWHVDLHQNRAGRSGGGAYLWHGGMITRSSITGNQADINGGGIAFRKSGGLYRSEVFGNTAVTNGGGVYFSDGGYLRESTISSNSAERGAGIYHSLAGDSKSVLLTANTASHRGGGVYCYKGGTLNSITVANNSAGEHGTGFYAYNGGTLENAIVWESTDPIYRSGTNIVMHHICTNDSNTNEIAAVVVDHPLFINEAAGDYQLQAQSPCIEAGINSNDRSNDLAIRSRIMGTKIDLGAYEWNFSSDSDGDGIPDAWEEQFFGGSTNANPNALAANGINTVKECYIANLNPTEADRPECAITMNEGTATVHFNSSNARNYHMLWSTNLVEGIWTPVAGARPGTGGADHITATNNAPQKFYQIQIELP